MTDPESISLSEIEATALALAPHLRETPVWLWQDELTARRLGPATKVVLKLELFQHAGSFKARGALNVMLGLTPAVRARGVTAVSAGNHAIAVAWAARTLATSAKVVMPKTADPLRVTRCHELGAETVLAEDVHAAFAVAQQIEREEGRTFVHPFEGPRTALGTGTLGRELLRQDPGLDAVIVPIGGGGLAGGLSAAIKQLKPSCLVLGVDCGGRDVITVEGLSSDGRLHPLQETFADLGAAQCGYCTPGYLVTAKALLDEHPHPTRDQIREALSGNLCRCTGYQQIFEAVEAAIVAVEDRSSNTTSGT